MKKSFLIPALTGLFAMQALAVEAQDAPANANVAPERQSSVQTEAALTPKQKEAVADAKESLETAFHPKNIAPGREDLAFALEFEAAYDTLKYEGGFDMETETPYQLIGTTKADFRQILLPYLKIVVPGYYQESLHVHTGDPHDDARLAVELVEQARYLMAAGGFDMDSDEPYQKFVHTTCAAWKEREKNLNIAYAKSEYRFFGEIVEAQKQGRDKDYLPDAGLHNAWMTLKKIGYDLDTEEPYRLLGTTKADFVAKLREYKVTDSKGNPLAPPEQSPSGTPAPSP
jgi:hypothetical protein